MSLEFVPPKYAQLAAELQRRIESGVYEPGTLMPSEHQLVEEFKVSRPTVVRALAVLREGGWIESRQGKGRYVRGRPALASVEQSRPGLALLTGKQALTGEVTFVGVAEAPNRIAGLLDVDPGTKVFLRRQLVRDDTEPVELVSVWLPLEVFEGTDLMAAELPAEGLREHIQSRKDVKFDHVLERVLARRPTAEETRILNMARHVPLLVVYATARDATGRPLLVLEIALPADRHELEDAYPLT